MVDPFNGSRIGSHTILKCGFGSKSIPKASSWGESCLPLLYSIVALFLADVGLEFFSTDILAFNLCYQYLMYFANN